ncbi:dihydrolipoyllysine-residue succinyltransferase [Buchnera aphidicola]|uniref:dihydrolipoyllysine-residue succinyltransferase n=1 Tax=Buchnera aphidicola TaxID=9 RepID=UPI00346456B0
MKQKTILVPELPESINSATVIKWHKKIDDIIKIDEVLVDIETEKVILEIPSEFSGKLIKISAPENTVVKNRQILGYIEEINNESKYKKNKKEKKSKKDIFTPDIKFNNQKENYYSPSIRRKCYLKKIKNNNNNFSHNIEQNKEVQIKENLKKSHIKDENRVPMTLIRKRITQRLLQTVRNTVMLTTFNEVNMQSILNLRNKYRDIFEKKYCIRLGLMSFFVKAVVESLKYFPEINAKIDNNDIIYHKTFDINIAISTIKGLVTPILKNADLMSMFEIEKKIKYFLLKGNEGKLELSDLIGGNFTITNGGTFGSLFSTPVLNPPQSAILGMHAIKDRVIVIKDKITVAPMMYIALSYDHRLIDGKEAVGFLNMIKNILEDFSRILLNI